MQAKQSLKVQFFLTACLVGLLAACAEEIPPRTVGEFIKNPIMLEAAIVRCRQDRSASRYDAECVNARQAVRQIEAKQDAIRRKEWEAQSERKRLALRRAQEAAQQARQLRAEDERRLREEAGYFATFGGPPAADETNPDGATFVLPAEESPATGPDANQGGD